MTPAKARIHDENIFAYLAAANWVLLAVLSVAGILFGSITFAGGIVAGGLLAILNFYWLLSVLRRVLQMPVKEAGRFAQARYLLRLSILAIIIWVLIRFTSISIFGLIVGLSITVINIVVLALYKVARKGG